MSRSFEDIMGTNPSEQVDIAIKLEGQAITAGNPYFPDKTDIKNIREFFNCMTKGCISCIHLEQFNLNNLKRIQERRKKLRRLK
jgi:hypothetical protein